MRVARMNEAEERIRLEASVSGLAERAPLVSARALLTPAQRIGLIGLAALLVICGILDLKATAIAVVAVFTAFYLVAVVYRFALFALSAKTESTIRISDEEARAFPDSELPTYTLLIPAYKEPEVISLLLHNIGVMEYPPDLVEVMVLVEADDTRTLEAIRSKEPDDRFQLVLVPPAEPRTKPKALNYGLTLARGELVAVYDVEDEPDPLQLRRAAVAFSTQPPQVGCLQAKLSYDNPAQNIITKWFTIEYTMWFSFFLPGLASAHAPIPLGGTSNHFRRDVLRRMGAWDPFNVTEDADLGIRMYREGIGVRILESVTFEEANSDFVNWTRQRSRWLKGYLQTFLIHFRQPVRLYRDLGWRGLLHFAVFVGGTPLLALANPAFWFMTVLWFVAYPSFIREIFPAPVYYAGLLCFTFGNFVMAYLTVVASRTVDEGRYLVPALLIPLYWIMMSMAAVKAFWQIVFTPTLWEKTFHGLGRTTAAEHAPPGAAGQR